jgi:hypothetical protein
MSKGNQVVGAVNIVLCVIVCGIIKEGLKMNKIIGYTIFALIYIIYGCLVYNKANDIFTTLVALVGVITIPVTIAVVLHFIRERGNNNE